MASVSFIRNFFFIAVTFLFRAPTTLTFLVARGTQISVLTTPSTQTVLGIIRLVARAEGVVFITGVSRFDLAVEGLMLISNALSSIKTQVLVLSILVLNQVSTHSHLALILSGWFPETGWRVSFFDTYNRGKIRN